MSENPLKIGLLGSGEIIRDFHLKVLQKNPRAQAAAVGITKSAQKVAREYEIPKVHSNFDEMADDSEIDAVIIGLPNNLHAPVTIQMLKAGKHVLCEKPMAMTVAQAQQMIDTAEGSARTLMIAHNWRHHAQVHWLRDVIKSRVLGRIFRVKAYHPWLDDGPQPDSWMVKPECVGGGAVADMGIHPLDTISCIFEDAIRPTRVFASGGTFFRDIPVLDTASIMIEYDNGMAAIIDTGWYHSCSNGPEGGIEVFGTDGYARLFPETLDIRGYAKLLPTELQRKTDSLWTTSRPEFPPESEDKLRMYELQADHFLDCILCNEHPIPDNRQALMTILLMNAACESIETGQSIVL